MATKSTSPKKETEKEKLRRWAKGEYTDEEVNSIERMHRRDFTLGKTVMD